MTKHSATALTLLAGLLLAAPEPAAAHNGTVGRALPVAGIAVDGDFADWPAGLPSHPLAAHGDGDAPTGPRDFSGSFRLGYDQDANALYLAIETADDSQVRAPDAGVAHSYDTQDGCEVYIGLHDPRGGRPPTQLYIRGDTTGVFGPGGTEAFAVRARQTDAGWRYEWRVDFAALGDGAVRLGPDRAIGFDISIWDIDADGSRSWISWSPGVDKYNTAGQLGDMLLLAGDTRLAPLAGRLTWRAPHRGPLPRRVRLHSLDAAELWVQAAVDSAGHYQTALPPGRYRITAVDELALRLEQGPGVDVRVGAPRATAPPLEAVPLPKPPIGPKGAMHGPLDPAAIDGFARASMEYYKIPGLSLALVKNGRVVFRRGYGLQRAGEATPVDETTLFEAASMTKPVFAYAVARLVERGVLDWDTPLHSYLPYEDIAHDARYKAITARMVVAHTTGFPNWRSGRLELLFDPGSQFGYSGEGFEYLGMVVSHLTGKDLTELVADEVFAPLGMENAYLVWNEDDHPAKAVAHNSGDQPGAGRNQWDRPFMAASLHTDAGNYGKFVAAIARGAGLPPDALAAMLRPQTQVPADWGGGYFGLGFSLAQTAHGPTFGHGGRNGGGGGYFTSNSVYYRDLDMGYVFLVNNDAGGPLDDDLRAFLITGREQPVDPALYEEIAQMDSAIFAAFNGRDLAAMKTFFTRDLEFYHDKAGLSSYDENIASIADLFGQDNDLSRQLAPGSLQVYPIKDYGAVQLGAHTFCHTADGQLDCGTFKFVHVWKKVGDEWKISRVISYDH